jgi:hypothetical protein
MIHALENRPSGRPALPLDPEKEALKERAQDLEAKLFLSKQSLEIQEILEGFPGLKELGEKKKKRKESKKKRRKKRQGG